MFNSYPDWGVQPSAVPSPAPDIAELGARLGFPSIRRTGKVLYYSRFSNSLDGWYTSLPQKAYISYNDGMNGNGLHIIPDAVNPSIQVRQSLFAFYNRVMGFEVNFQFAGDPTFSVEVTHIPFIIVPAFRVSSANRRIELRTDPGDVWVNASDVVVFSGSWNNLKLTWDRETGNYKRLWINSREYDVSSLQVATPVVIGDPQMTINLTGSGALGDVVNVNHFILTTDEA